MIPALITVGALIALYLLLFLGCRRFVVRRERIAHQKIDLPFTLVQVSDLHNSRFGRDQQKLLSAIRDAEPDAIVLTGDLFNRHVKSAFENAYAFVKGAKKIAPVYFAEGNHEIALREAGEQYIESIRQMGATVLRDEYVDLPFCRLIGLRQYASPQTLASMLDDARLSIVLAHRPELFPIYAGTGADIVLSGHAHGGQIRLFKKGIYAPGQGFFPRFDSGPYLWDHTLLYVSKGLGNTIPVPRVFDTPELNILIFEPKNTEE